MSLIKPMTRCTAALLPTPSIEASTKHSTSAVGLQLHPVGQSIPRDVQSTRAGPARQVRASPVFIKAPQANTEDLEHEERRQHLLLEHLSKRRQRDLWTGQDRTGHQVMSHCGYNQ